MSLIDREKYETDLLLFRREGLFLESLPEDVRVIDGGEDYSLFDGSASAYLKDRLRRGRLGDAVNRLKYARALKADDRAAVWDCLKKALPVPDKHYDAAIGYLEGNSVYYCVDCVDADVKIGYVHNDYSKLGMDAGFDRPYFNKLDSLVTVSEQCAEVLREVFPECARKVAVVENITSPQMIRRFAEGEAPEFAGCEKLKLLTIGRLREQKGYDLALEAAAKMKKEGLDFLWLAVGTGELYESIQSGIRQNSLEDSFVLLGERANPYPYTAACDIYVQPSRFEGKSIAIDEAKCLCKPIVTTDFSTVADQLTDGETALIAGMDGESIAARITELAGDEALRRRLSENLAEEETGNESEINKFYSLIIDKQSLKA